MRKPIPNGAVFSRLTVIQPGNPKVKPSGGRDNTSLCRCECGQELEVRNYCLRDGHTKSCGCLSKEITSSNRRKHGLSGSLEYDVWMAMRKRCENESDPRWNDYGGRGITVCERWKTFELFLEDMGRRPFPDAQIDRIENDGNYEPGNVKWSTRTEQARNKRNTRNLTVDGETKPMMAWCEEYEIDYFVVHSRIRMGWDAIAALTTPIQA